MRRTQATRHARTAALICSLALAACAPEQAVTVPVPETPETPTGLGGLGRPSYMATDLMTVTDANGVTYTLNAVKSQIRTSTGKTVSLTASQLATYASYFQDANNGTTTVDSVSTGTGPIDYEPYGIGGSGHGGKESRVQVRFGGGAPMDLPRATPGSGPVSILSGDDCYDLEVAIFNETKTFNDARDSWTAALNALIDVAIASWTSSSTPPLLSTGAEVLAHDLSARTMMGAWTRLNALATQYKVMGCWRTFWGSPGPGGDTAGPASMGSSRLVCKVETAWVSIAGGAWKSVDVTVCEYVLYNQ